MAKLELDIPTPRWSVPLLEAARYKGAKGGRASGKSHFFAELAVEEMVCDPSLRFVCIREVQRSLRFSAKSLVESKIRALGVGHMFEVLTTEIRRRGGTGLMIFEGMQDHTADSLKSLEGFGRAWVEEAQSISHHSLSLLIPTFRAPGSQMWFSWNPDQPDDPVDTLFQDLEKDDPKNEEHRLVHVNYTQNPFCTEESKKDALRLRRVDPDAYAHIWLGQYNVKSEAIVLAGKWREDEFEPANSWDGPYFGADWGFSQDPTVLVKCWIGAYGGAGENCLMVEHETGGVQWDNDTIERKFRELPGAIAHMIRADNARPETIHEMKKRGFRIQAADKWSGSVEDGIQHLRSYDRIIIHSRCKRALEEARTWRYKVNKAGDVLPKLEPGQDHLFDALRYALAPLIKRTSKPSVWFPGMDS